MDDTKLVAAARYLVEDIADAGDRVHERRVGHECMCSACEDARRRVALKALTTAFKAGQQEGLEG